MLEKCVYIPHIFCNEKKFSLSLLIAFCFVFYAALIKGPNVDRCIGTDPNSNVYNLISND